VVGRIRAPAAASVRQDLADIARHDIFMHFEPSFLEFIGVL